MTNETLGQKLDRYHELHCILEELQSEIEETLNKQQPYELANRTRVQFTSDITAVIERDPMGQIEKIDFEYHFAELA